MARRYSNLNPQHVPNGFMSVLRWAVLDRLKGRRRRGPAGRPAPHVPADLGWIAAAGPQVRLTWIGHASFLASFASTHFLIDPVFSQRVGWVVRRFGRPGITVSQLPRLTALRDP